MNEFMNIAINEAKKAYKKGDIPVGCVIVKNNKIIAKAYNKKEKNKIATNHAEIIAINKACKKLKTWHLDDCTLYTTMEPCVMCAGAIMQSRIKNIIYILKNDNFGYIENNDYFKKNKYNIQKIENNEVLDLIQEFFSSKR